MYYSNRFKYNEKRIYIFNNKLSQFDKMKRENREQLGKRAVYVAIIGNVFLTIFNIAVGIMAGSYALISEGAHTISDITTSIIAYIGFKIGSKPADDEHPLGHGRAESIAGYSCLFGSHRL